MDKLIFCCFMFTYLLLLNYSESFGFGWFGSQRDIDIRLDHVVLCPANKNKKILQINKKLLRSLTVQVQ